MIANGKFPAGTQKAQQGVGLDKGGLVSLVHRLVPLAFSKPFQKACHTTPSLKFETALKLVCSSETLAKNALLSLARSCGHMVSCR